MKRAKKNSPPPITECRTKQGTEINQTYCLIATGGHLWMRGYFDSLPVAARRRLRESAFNICPACLVTEVMPTVQRQHPYWPRERLLFAAIDVMEAQVRQGEERTRARERECRDGSTVQRTKVKKLLSKNKRRK